MTMIEYLRMHAKRCQQLWLTPLDLASASAFRLMADEHLQQAKLEEGRIARGIPLRQRP
jgi:hypothetical protein